MDPLTVTASIVGLIAAATKVVELVQPFVSNTKNAPKLALAIQANVNLVSIVLESLEPFLEDLASPNWANEAACIRVDHVVIPCAEGVLLFSELDSVLVPLESLNNARLQLYQRLLWVSKEKAMASMVDRVQRFLIDLTALLNIFQRKPSFESSVLGGLR